MLSFFECYVSIQKHMIPYTQVFVKEDGGKEYTIDQTKPYFTEIAKKYKESFGINQKKGKAKSFYEAKLGESKRPTPYHKNRRGHTNLYTYL